MNYDPNIHHRKSSHLKGYDYSKGDLYFVTFWTNDLACLFGKIVDDKMVLNTCGKCVYDEWLKDSVRRKYTIPDVFVVMPNHFHGIFFHDKAARNNFPFSTVDRIVRKFKISLTKKINILQNSNGVKILQHIHLEEIIRNKKSYLTFSEHIINNPINWVTDNLYKE
jgi:hypothetical protein